MERIKSIGISGCRTRVAATAEAFQHGQNLLVEFKVEAESVLYVYDNTGRQVMYISIDANNHFINLDVSNLSNGHYFLRIANQNSSLTGKFDINR